LFKPSQDYYQWPSFFILSYIVTSVSGLSLANFEFLLFTIIGFLLSTTLYIYASRLIKSGGFLVVAVFFVSMFYFLDYQNVPFSLALGLLFLLFMLEDRQKSSSLVTTITLLFLSISITHLFVPVFFILYLLIRSLLNRSRLYASLFLLTSTIYFIIQTTLAQFSFPLLIASLRLPSSQYSAVVSGTLAPSLVPTDVIAQTFSRTVTVAFILICGVGFVFLVAKRKIRALDKAIFLTGAAYSILGVGLPTLGWRALPVAFIPISLGAAYLFKSKFKPFFKYLFSVLIVVLLILFAFVPLHLSFNLDVQFQTQEAYRAENFVLNHYNWTLHNLFLSNNRVITYLQAKLSTYYPYFGSDPATIQDAGTVFYTIGLGNQLANNSVMQDLFTKEKLDMQYNNGFSYLTIKAYH
jgi:hypothetical protein